MIRQRLMRTLRGVLVAAPLCVGMPATSGCGTSLEEFDEALEDLFEDLEDADDFEDIDEAFEDFEEELDD